ncbi:MAG: hypothetical protein ABIH69_04825 [bacterium]|nr:hypothetical protein [Candidatus Margulisiibacteriota bacterium]
MSTQAQIKKYVLVIGKKLAEGRTSGQICTELKISRAQFRTILKHLANHYTEEAKTLWITFYLQMAKSYQDIWKLKDRAERTNNLNAQIGALRLQVELIDKMVSLVQKLGLLPEKQIKNDVSLEEMALRWEKLFGFQGIKPSDIKI